MSKVLEIPNWGTVDLHKDILPYVKIDYLTVTCHSGTPPRRMLLEDDLKKLKPNLNIIHLNHHSSKNNAVSSLSWREKFLRDNFYKTNVDTKNNEKDYDLIFYEYITKDFLKEYARIPGNLAHQYVEGILKKEIQFNDHDFSVSRLDVKIEIPGFVYTDFGFDCEQFLGFHEIQHLERVRVDHEKGFAVGYIGQRRQRAMFRTYISKSRAEKTAEIEWKLESAKQLGFFLYQADIYMFNKTIILGLLDFLKKLASCLYTQPLLEWSTEYLEEIKNREFPKEAYYQRKQKSHVVTRVQTEHQIREILAKKNQILNINLVRSSLNNDICLQLLILCFCSKKLLSKWKENYGNSSEIKALLHTQNWADDDIKAETFRFGNNYQVEFQLNDLLVFLNMPKTTKSREKMISVIKLMMNFKVEFWVEKTKFFQPLVYSVAVDHRRGVPAKISLILHPFAVYDLLNYAVIFCEHFQKNYYVLLDKHRLNQSKKSFHFSYFAFVSLTLAFKTRQQFYFKEFLSKRNKKKPDLRNRQLEFLMDFITLISDYSNTDLGVDLNGKRNCPMGYNVFRDIVDRAGDKILDKAEFFFEFRNGAKPTDEFQEILVFDDAGKTSNTNKNLINHLPLQIPFFSE